MMSASIAVLVVAAGKGERAGGGLPKQYRPVLGMPLLALSVARVRRALPDARVICVIGADDSATYAAAMGENPPQWVIGGATRQLSVLAGLEAFDAWSPEIVLIHDAARPLGIERTAPALLAAIAQGGFDGAAPALPVVDSLRRREGDAFTPASRADLWRVQTPQAFRFAPILAAHRAAAGQGGLTDDLQVAEHAGLKITLVEGDERSMKVTEAADFDRLTGLLLAERGDIRVGHGYDVHAFGPGDAVTLCGVRVPHTAGLAGHSDADVGLHALTDAVLGAIGAEDIGAHFPPGDARWKGAASDAFLRQAASLVTARDGVVAHVDVTLVCEAPKVGPHRAAMTARIAEILGLSQDRVSVKATTTEKLGFTGRREGIAAYATATVRLPS